MISCMRGEIMLALTFWICAARGTVDLNLQELEYVADHLKKKDCRKLVAALHDPNFNLVNNIDAAERKIPDDVSCLKLLLHWNSQPGEGKGETHVVLAHRLKQLGHENLADWLSRTVFHQLGQDLNRTLLTNPFKELAQTNETEESVKEILTPMGEEEMNEWLPIDTIFCVLILFLISVIIFILARVAWLYLFKKQRKNQIKKKQTRKQAQWKLRTAKSAKLSGGKQAFEHTAEESKQFSISSSSESEEDEAAFSMLGLKKPNTV